MQYVITGGIEKGIHYTQFKEQDDEEGMQSNERAVKSYGEKETEKLDTE